MDEVKGFKAFNKNSTNRYGKPFTEGSTHRVTGEIKFGNDGNGFHMCTSLCDVFRYVNADTEEVLVGEVTGRGRYVKRDDNYNGYYDMYSFEEMTIDRFMSWEEVIDRMLNASSVEVIKFLITVRLSEVEKVLFARQFRNDIGVMKTLLYYHYGYREIFKIEHTDAEECIRLVLKNGQNNN